MFDSLIRSNFIDYYDHELCCPLGFYNKKIERYSNKLSHAEQFKILDSAGIRTADLASFFELFSPLKRKKLNKRLDWTKVPCFMSLSGKLHSVESAKREQPSLDFLKYVQIGSKGFWGHFVRSHGKTRLFNIISHESLPATSLRSINRPLFTIDFGTNERELLAINIDVGPNLKELGIDAVFEAKEIADLLLPSLEISESTVPRFLNEKGLWLE